MIRREMAAQTKRGRCGTFDLQLRISPVLLQLPMSVGAAWHALHGRVALSNETISVAGAWDSLRHGRAHGVHGTGRHP